MHSSRLAASLPADDGHRMSGVGRFEESPKLGKLTPWLFRRLALVDHEQDLARPAGCVLFHLLVELVGVDRDDFGLGAAGRSRTHPTQRVHLEAALNGGKQLRVR